MFPLGPCHTRHFCKQYCNIAVHLFRTINLLRMRNLQHLFNKLAYFTDIVKFHTVLAFWKHLTFVKLRCLKLLFQNAGLFCIYQKMLSIVQRSSFLEEFDSLKLIYLKHLFQKSWTILYLPKMLSIVQRSSFLEQNGLPGRLEYEISVILRKVLDWRWFLQCLILILVKFSVLILHSVKKSCNQLKISSKLFIFLKWSSFL